MHMHMLLGITGKLFSLPKTIGHGIFPLFSPPNQGTKASTVGLFSGASMKFSLALYSHMWLAFKVQL